MILGANYVWFDFPLHPSKVALPLPFVLTHQSCHCKQWTVDDKKFQKSKENWL